MNENYTYNFYERTVKQGIESVFYQIAASHLKLDQRNKFSVVTGPDWERHVDNINKIFGERKICIYETNDKIFSQIVTEVGDRKDIKIRHKSIEKADSIFIDCDLTCGSDIKAINNALLSQIKSKATYMYPKAFIATIGLRNNTLKYDTIFRKLFGLLGARCQAVREVYKMKLDENPPCYQHEIRFQLIYSRVIEYKCYSYNAGGGPMVTLLIIYK